MSARGLGAFLVGMGGGYLQAKQREDDNKDREQQRQIRQMQIDDLQQQRSDDQALRGASAETVVSDGNAGPMPEGQEARVRGQGFASMADAQAAAPAMDTPQAQQARRAQVLRSQGKGMQAAQESLALTQTNAMEQEMADKVYARSLGRSLVMGGWEAFTKQLSDSPFGGAKFGLVKDAKGKKVRIQVLGEDGKDTGDGMDFSDDEDGRMKALGVAMSVSDPKARLDFYRWSKDANQKQANWLAEMGLKEKELASQDRYRTSMAGAAGGGGSAPVWGDKDDEFLRKRYTITDEAGQTRVDGGGLQFAKKIALAQAQKNGGDTTSALGFAFDIDQKIAAKVGNDPAKIAAARQKYLAAVTGGRGKATQEGQAERDVEASRIRLNEVGGDPARVAGEIQRIKAEMSRVSGEQRSFLQQELGFWEGAAALAVAARAVPAASKPAASMRDAAAQEPSRLQLMRSASQYRPPAKPVDLAGMAAAQGGNGKVTAEEVSNLSRIIR